MFVAQCDKVDGIRTLILGDGLDTLLSLLRLQTRVGPTLLSSVLLAFIAPLAVLPHEHRLTLRTSASLHCLKSKHIIV